MLFWKQFRVNVFFLVKCQGFPDHIRHPYLLETKFRFLYIGLFWPYLLEINCWLINSLFFWCVDSIGKLLIISFFVLKRMLSIMYIRDITTLHSQHTNAGPFLTPHQKTKTLQSTVFLDSTPKDKNLAIRNLNRSGRYLGTHPRVETSWLHTERQKPCNQKPEPIWAIPGNASPGRNLIGPCLYPPLLIYK